ncbi:DUF4190 domain-containing protein [Gardnerella leopoldii]|uniref:DUF4190 domain-containing protein n=1 Tax=Gardnerella leopoldii TaxID=2792978 RepID=UPI0002EE39DB|nr:DUF4190 domain-containing protein [Gardnerella leopoldii]NSX41585.1 DUF4190 domain-containing protein [Gardnerella vaginalis]NSX44508.1 DUF4190 domain-containing protein [Gardnerella vaginalis]RIY30850.1 hypothetical protein CJI48_00685 [Bifidobacteriaceae bacterium GH005]
MNGENMEMPPVNNDNNNKHLSGLGVSALVLGIISIVFSIIPIINNLCIVLGVLVIVFAGCSWKSTGKKGHKRGHGMVIAGLVLGILSIVITLSMQASFSASIDKAKSGLDKASKKLDNMAKGIANENAKEMKIQVKGTAPTDINLLVSGSNSNESTNNGVWEKVFTGKDAQKDWTIMASPKIDVNNPTPDNYKVECSITVDGKEVSHKSATGTSANVMCTASDTTAK